MQISPVTRPKSAARQAYDRLSGIYDPLAGSSETPLMKLGLQMLHIDEGMTVLEIGCGTGKALSRLVEQVGDTGSVQGIDLSPGMLSKAQERLKNYPNINHVSLIVGDGATLPYHNECFSAIFMSFTLELFDTPEIPMLLAECQRVLIPCGQLGVVALFRTVHPSWIVRLYEWFHAHLPDYVDCRPINASELIQAAGFSIEKQIVKSMWGLPVSLLTARKK